MHNIFSQPDEAKHAADKKLVAKYYSPTGVACLEPLIDKTIAQLCDELDKRFTTTASPTSAAKVFDLGDWISYCSSLVRKKNHKKNRNEFLTSAL